MKIQIIPIIGLLKDLLRLRHRRADKIIKKYIVKYTSTVIVINKIIPQMPPKNLRSLFCG
jgi:hypothetical protein